MRSSHLLPLALLASVCLACPDETVSADCVADADCPLAGTRCDLEAARCVCVTDEACEEDSFCNRAGVCQARAGCTRASDCPEGSFCDALSGDCLEGPALALEGACGLATHCPYNTVCVDGRCAEGCFDDGDCVLGQVCLDGLCAAGTGLCTRDEFCDFRERCVDGQCERDRRGPYCRGCTQRTVFNPEPCDDPKNFCLVNSAETEGFPQFCGVDCALGQPCPNGYDCSGVVILTERSCTFTAQCRCEPDRIAFATKTCTVAAACDPRLPDGSPDGNATGCTAPRHPDCNPPEGGDASCLVGVGDRSGSCTCATDADCAGGTVCVAGVCCGGPVRDDRDCAVGEGRVSGFCTCATDEDCPRDSCDAARGACLLTGEPCTPGNNDCGPVPCVNGGCVIGANCAPVQGLACSDVGAP